MKHTIIFILFPLCMPGVLGAAIYGNIYDLSLDKVSGAVVEVNTTPQQKLIAQDGKYAFEIPKGTYRIVAELRENGRATARENKTLTVLQDGNYVIDMILFPVIDDGKLGEPDIGNLQDMGRTGTPWVIGAIAGVLLLAVLAGGMLYARSRKRANELYPAAPRQDAASSKEEHEDAAQLLAIIKRHGGRATQKELRRELPLSEAKISLLLTELEHRKRIEKIRKGRGNVVVLKE